MLSATILSRASRSVGRSALSLLPSSTTKQQKPLQTLANQFVHGSPNRFFTSQVSLLHRSAFKSSPFRFGFSSSASPEPNEKENGNAAESAVKSNGETKESDSELEVDLSHDDLVKLVAEREELLKSKQEEMKTMQDKLLRAYAEMENVMSRTKREAENSKKFAVQSFAKSLLDVADNLGRASSSVKDSLAKIDESKDEVGAVSVIKTLLEGVEMTDKQLLEVFKKSGIEKFDPVNEPFDPHRHNAMFQVPDGSKPPGTICHVLKSGYILYDRVIRPAEVGVTVDVEKN